MILYFKNLNEELIAFDTTEGIDISIAYTSKFDQVNCFYAPFFQDEPVKMGSFIGSVEQGGPVNFFNTKINIHGNGTHTECVGHISKERESILDVLNENIFLAHLISLYPTQRENGDKVIERFTLENLWPEGASDWNTLIIRTLPNDSQKKSQKYSGTNPTFIDVEAMRFIVEKGIQHILVDLPSVDREEDGGRLEAHNCFWMDGRAKKCTITELIYVPDSVLDGKYVLNLQTASIASDAVPSKPILYKLK